MLPKVVRITVLVDIPKAIILILLPATIAAAATTAAIAAATSAAAAATSTLSWSSIAVSSDVGCRPLGFLFIVGLVEGNCLGFVQTLVPILVDSRKVKENIFTTIIRGDETESLITEEFYLTRICHLVLSLSCINSVNGSLTKRMLLDPIFSCGIRPMVGHQRRSQQPAVWIDCWRKIR